MTNHCWHKEDVGTEWFSCCFCGVHKTPKYAWKCPEGHGRYHKESKLTKVPEAWELHYPAIRDGTPSFTVCPGRGPEEF
jgi:hypothetical protein